MKNIRIKNPKPDEEEGLKDIKEEVKREEEEDAERRNEEDRFTLQQK